MVACPPQVTMLTLAGRAPPAMSRLFKLTGGTQNGPMAAGVRSIMSTPSALSLALFSACT
ncbi:hypothetical protein D3C71_534780 [compost metagenome]